MDCSLRISNWVVECVNSDVQLRKNQHLPKHSELRCHPFLCVTLCFYPNVAYHVYCPSSHSHIPYIRKYKYFTIYSRCIGLHQRPRIACCLTNKAHQLCRPVNQIRHIVGHPRAVLLSTTATAKLNGALRAPMWPISSEIMKFKLLTISTL